MSFQSYSDYSDESDDEYAPIQISGWGTQQTQEGTTEVTVSMEGWSSLVDPTVKMKAGGIGSGQLHRKGKNFKPVDEQLILDRRLGKPLPKGGLNGEAKKKKKKKGKGGAPPQSKMPPPPKPSKTMPPTFNRNRPPIKPGASAWSSNALVETPFWEKPNGSAASKWADPAPAAAPVSAPPVTQPSSWSQQQQQQQQQQRTQPQQQWSQPPQQQQWAQPPQQPQQQQWAQPQPQQQWSHPQPQQQQPQSMWAQPQQQQPHQQAHQQAPGWPHQPLLGTNASKYATPSAQTQSFAHPPQPAISQKSDIPKLTFKIELAPGVTANLPVYANDNPVDVVNEFEKKHHLVMSDAAKAKFAERVAMLLSQTAFSN
ncbi:hypothetical protein G6F57_005560 [Rhizopus arrhizus]|uniref:Uncharacterized protein n=1 Tax=Rhizopus oryzae TaxID=64495 RepID=A0A9P6XA99_RHIOR|nr:hypothetical protein G6F30_006552 [Rhizopus arrhizus]KAG1425237.1 hypothetical protein G6F58_002025 [Rhizopus delemar]KAG0981436.1 hypothetical protein G6F29_007055 [Rhizopus arrhizus]KAG0999744.1 hypothetical protein G6F28_000710 [Rhizopus arrhizus]KAG1015309.1 hypothetical protein G6F27_000175 [Rhizopus arrhizus]